MLPHSGTSNDRPKRTARWLTAGGSLAIITIILGCMSFSIGGSKHVARDYDGVLEQCGECTIAPGEARDIFYPIPYASPPNLEIESTFDHCVLVDQQPGYFRVRNTDTTWARDAEWTARGVRAPPSLPSPPPTVRPPPAVSPPTPGVVPHIELPAPAPVPSTTTPRAPGG